MPQISCVTATDEEFCRCAINNNGDTSQVATCHMNCLQS